MFLHQYLQRKSDILKRAEAEIKTLLDDIRSPELKEKVKNWKVGDPISDKYSPVDQKVDDGAGGAEQLNKSLPAAAPEVTKPVADPITEHTTESSIAIAAKLEGTEQTTEPATIDKTTGETQAAAGAQLNHQPEGQPQQQSAGGNAPA
jgi:hypothetical protein